jgi:hypothetical protein
MACSHVKAVHLECSIEVIYQHQSIFALFWALYLKELLYIQDCCFYFCHKCGCIRILSACRNYVSHKDVWSSIRWAQIPIILTSWNSFNSFRDFGWRRFCSYENQLVKKGLGLHWLCRNREEIFALIPTICIQSLGFQKFMNFVISKSNFALLIMGAKFLCSSELLV